MKKIVSLIWGVILSQGSAAQSINSSEIIARAQAAEKAIAIPMAIAVLRGAKAMVNPATGTIISAPATAAAMDGVVNLTR